MKRIESVCRESAVTALDRFDAGKEEVAVQA
jgi:hypothetical protein